LPDDYEDADGKIRFLQKYYLALIIASTSHPSYFKTGLKTFKNGLAAKIKSWRPSTSGSQRKSRSRQNRVLYSFISVCLFIVFELFEFRKLKNICIRNSIFKKQLFF
jgi:hypothetical protein